MHRTIFDTPVVSAVLRLLSALVLRLSGWSVVGERPDNPKLVLIAAPHTSNWDLPFMLMVAFSMGTPIYWMGKDSIFKFPFSNLMRWMGGIPIDRSQANNVVSATAEVFKQTDRLIIAVPPEGTRSLVKYWKTGFYYIAQQAEVPIALGFLDFATKQGGVGPILQPTGDLDQDMKFIKSFYAQKKGKCESKYEEAPQTSADIKKKSADQ